MVRTGQTRVVIFDLGGVLIDWNPRYLFRKLLTDEAAVDEFLGEVCTQAWNEEQDAGRPLAEATAALCARHPDRAELIAAYYGRWDEMIAGAIDDSVVILEELDRRRVPLYALSNFSAETFALARARFAFLARFRAIVLSGEERLTKPDPRLYRLLLGRHAIDPAEALFVDDNLPNVEAARRLGMTGHHFRSPAELRRELVDLGLL